MQEKLNLFVSIHKRSPINGEEFANWCEYMDNNSTIKDRIISK